MKKVAIIGAGVFGTTAALELSKNNFEVVVFDRTDNILTGASTVNHLRHHFGFHYPRSKETVEEIKIARKSFEQEYGQSLSSFFDDYYGISLVGSKTAPEGFIDFCNRLKLPYIVSFPEEKYLDRKKIGICIKTPERVYDPDVLKGLILRKIRAGNIKLKLNHNIIGGDIKDKCKLLKIRCGSRNFEEKFDFVVNATYSNFNQFNKLMGFPRKTLLYELVELLEIQLPDDKKIGLTIMDGQFSSVLPRGEKGTFTLGHVKESVLAAVTSNDLDTFKMSSENTKSNKKNILKKGIEDFPFLKDAEVIRSLFVTRVVKANVDATDERPSEITQYGNGIYSIFGGKVITCCNIAKKITGLIKKESR